MTQINLSPRRPFIDAVNLSELVEAYIVDARLRVKPHTADAYDYLLAHLLRWWAGAGPPLGYRLDANGWCLFDGWLAQQVSSQSGQPLTLNTRRSCLARCRQLLHWAYKLDYLDRDFSGDVPSVSGVPAQRAAPDGGQLVRLLAAATTLRDQALIALFIGTGVRRAEAAALDVEDVSFHADGGGAIHIRTGKGNRPRTVVFDRACGEYLSALLDAGTEAGPLFCGWKGKRLTPESVYRVVKTACRRAGIDERGRGPHDLRRAFATEWLRHRRDLGAGQLLSMQLGHSNQQTSLLYSKQTFDDLQENFTSPLGGLRSQMRASHEEADI